jgi:hypothetical protein
LWNCRRSERRYTLCIPIEFFRGSSMIHCNMYASAVLRVSAACVRLRVVYTPLHIKVNHFLRMGDRGVHMKRRLGKQGVGLCTVLNLL